MTIVAVDVDLRKITMVFGDTVIADREDLPPRIVGCSGPILCEIAGSIMHSVDGRDACPPGKRRWMLYNMGWIAQLAVTHPNVLVATSTAWTKGYKEAQRHSIAGMDPLKFTKAGHPVYKYAHDVRECFAMLHFYHLDPKVWVPLSQYLENL